MNGSVFPHNSRTSTFFCSSRHNIYAKWQIHATVGWVSSEGESCSRAVGCDLYHYFSPCAFRKPVMPCKWFCMIKVKLIRIEHLSFDWNNDCMRSLNFLSVHFYQPSFDNMLGVPFLIKRCQWPVLLNWESKFTRGGGLTQIFINWNKQPWPGANTDVFRNTIYLHRLHRMCLKASGDVLLVSSDSWKSHVV